MNLDVHEMKLTEDVYVFLKGMELHYQMRKRLN